MDTIKIGSFNFKDNKINRDGGIRQDGISNAEILAKEIENQQFDLIGTQELTINYVSALAFHLKNYRFYGKYRYGNLLTNLPYNENNNILTNKKVLSSKTIWLPWIPKSFEDKVTSVTKMSIMPRIATIIITEDEKYGKICMINTHLDYQIPSLQIKQLEAIRNLVLKYGQTYPVVLTGDFNMEIGTSYFDDFISKIEDINMQRVQINDKTWYDKDGVGKTLDHIFIPSDWNVEDAGVIDSKGTSDHNIIYVEAKADKKTSRI